MYVHNPNSIWRPLCWPSGIQKADEWHSQIRNSRSLFSNSHPDSTGNSFEQVSGRDVFGGVYIWKSLPLTKWPNFASAFVRHLKPKPGISTNLRVGISFTTSGHAGRERGASIRSEMTNFLGRSRSHPKFPTQQKSSVLNRFRNRLKWPQFQNNLNKLLDDIKTVTAGG